MTDPLETTLTRVASHPRAGPRADDRGWYLYGITRPGALDDARPEYGQGDRGEPERAVGPLSDDGEPVQMLECGDLAAIVRRVPLAEFGAEALQARLRDAACLEAMVRSHNEVIAAVHRGQAILPAKFGCVYARADDLTAALQRSHAPLVAQLERLAGCDEWAIHVYASRPAVQQRVGEDPTLQQLQQELADARPGRAYFLRRRLGDELAAATERVLGELGQAAYDQLVPRAVAGQVNPPSRPAPDASGELEILRAAFLVQRASLDRFVAEVHSLPEIQEGLRCEFSGPWPPYSFAAPVV